MQIGVCGFLCAILMCQANPFLRITRISLIMEFTLEELYTKKEGQTYDRMFNEIATAGLPAPEYRHNAFMLNATIRNGAINEAINGAINISATEQTVLSAIKKSPKITKVELQKETTLGKSTIDRAIKSLKGKCFIERVGSNKTGYWKIINKEL